MYDQWRTYLTLFGQPFPDNVIQLDNGHRPIIPNLFRVAEIRWFSANQLLQIIVGVTSAFLTSLLISVSVWRQREMPVTTRCAGILFATLGIFWLANARMLLHGNELLHVYLLTLAVTGAILCTYEAHYRQSIRWYSLATGACSIAMFCFGPGVASFPAIILLGISLRLPWRWHALPLVSLLLLLFVYTSVLPGNESVRHMAALRPVDSLFTMARWLSSPWVNGWLGLADPPLQPWLVPSDPPLAHVLQGSASTVLTMTGVGWRSLSTIIGLAGIVIVAIRFCLALVRGNLQRIEVLMLGIGIFAIATAAEIGIMRLDYLVENPQETYSDRYLVWPSLFWMAIAILGVHDAWRLRNKAASVAMYTFASLLPLVLLTTQSAWSGWGAAVYREAQRLAAAARSGVVPPAMVLSDPAANRTMRLATLHELRSRHLAMFADTAWERVGTHWNGVVERTSGIDVSARAVESVEDIETGASALHFDGFVAHGIGVLRPLQQLAVLDDEGTIAGLAEFSFIAPDASSLRLSVPRKRGFDGYIAHPDPARTYTLVSLDFDRARAIALTTLDTRQLQGAVR